jgi:hypothetical protein
MARIFNLDGDEERFDYQAILLDDGKTIFLRIWITNFNKVEIRIAKPEEVPKLLRDKYYIETGERY